MEANTLQILLDKLNSIEGQVTRISVQTDAINEIKDVVHSINDTVAKMAKQQNELVYFVNGLHDKVSAHEEELALRRP